VTKIYKRFKEITKICRKVKKIMVMIYLFASNRVIKKSNRKIDCSYFVKLDSSVPISHL